MGQKALGAAFSHARASGKDQSRAAQRRRANAWLKREGKETMSRKVAKGILDRWRAMTTDERADEFNLRASGVPPDVARALAMTGDGKAPERKPKFGGLISKMGPTLAELDVAGHTTGLTGSQALRGAAWRKRKLPKKQVAKGGPGSGPRPGGGTSIASHLSAASSHLAASKAARGKGDHTTADMHRQKAADRIQAALRASSVNKAGEWDESKHPRAANGEFGSSSGGASSRDRTNGTGKGERIGSTKGQRPIFSHEKPDSEHYKGFTAEDHDRAANAHNAKQGNYEVMSGDEARKLARHHENLSIEHTTAAKRLDQGLPVNQTDDDPVVGKTRNGFVVHAHRSPEHESYKNMTWADHHDAAIHHTEASEGLISQARKKQHRDLATAHDDKATEIRIKGADGTSQFSEKEHDAVRDFVDSSFHMNFALLSKHDGDVLDPKQTEAYDKAQIINEMVQKSPLKADRILFHGGMVPQNLKKGDVFSSPRLMSTSSDPLIAHMFTEQRILNVPGKTPAFVEIKARKGSKALDINYALNEERGKFTHQEENVFGSGQKFRVIRKTHRAGIVKLIVETVSEHSSKKVTKAMAVKKRHMVSQLADQYITAAYDQPRLPAGQPQYTDPPEFARYLDAQRLVAGMDDESAAGAATPAVARARASRALATSMGHYDRTVAGPDRSLAHVGGLNLDLGSGQARERGFLGVDTYPYDYGTVVADLGLGIPFPDGCARAVRLWQALPALEDYRDDPTALMQEVQRVLTIGGRFYYQGPPLQDAVDWSKLPGLGIVSHQFGAGGRQLTLTLQRQAARLPVVYGADVQHLGRTEASPAEFAQAQAEFGELPSADVAMANLVAKTAPVEVRASIVKKRDWDRVVLGPILIPDVPDSQNDTMTAADIEETAHNFLADARLVGREHSDTWDGAQVVESYIAPSDLSFADDMYGPQVVPKGSWILGVRIPEDSWADVLDGSVTGFSVGGWGEREDVI